MRTKCPVCDGHLSPYNRVDKCWYCEKCRSVVARCIKCRRLFVGKQHLFGEICNGCFEREPIVTARVHHHGQKSKALFQRIVEEGGVYWKCKKDARHMGVLKPDAVIAKVVRRQVGIEPPDPTGIEFNAKTCPLCRKTSTTSSRPARLARQGKGNPKRATRRR